MVLIIVDHIKPFLGFTQQNDYIIFYYLNLATSYKLINGFKIQILPKFGNL